ncbi:hypothetical protein JCGZ_21740 [Jatropha curcas]|uniref:Uncharacterized protein n=1 Tax=Jatropha curcas TaxID=180498 RepID=A0A067JP28_JATCU|nr:hypothetical protein JCGZ_21740 [Jatropha curcas]
MARKFKAINKKKCLCEKTIELMVNIVKMSSITLASTMCLTPAMMRQPATTAGSLVPVDEISISSKYQVPVENQKCQELLDGNHDIDKRAGIFISKIREENFRRW